MRPSRTLTAAAADALTRRWGNSHFLLPKPIRHTILASKPPESVEFRLRARWLLGVTMEIAASVEYQTIPPPEGLPDGMKPLQGATLRFLSIKSIDQFEVIAALWQTQDKSPEDTTLLVQVHGSGDNLTGLPLQAVAQAFSSRGYAALTINTRQHDERVNTDNFFDVRRDIEAAVATAKALGYGSIVLAGHSLGTVQVAFYAATDWDPAIRAVILMARSPSCRGSRGTS